MKVGVAGLLDDELKQLLARVSEVFGDDAACAAVDRASVTMPHVSASETPLLWAQTYRAAVKAELHRLIRPQ